MKKEEADSLVLLSWSIDEKEDREREVDHSSSIHSPLSVKVTAIVTGAHSAASAFRVTITSDEGIGLGVYDTKRTKYVHLNVT